VWVGCFRPPSVPDGISRLRLTARANLSEADLDRAVEVITRNAPAS
jgi:8-amino-7-oxononanoate synthase